MACRRVEDKGAHTGFGRLALRGGSQRQTTPQASASLGQPRPASAKQPLRPRWPSAGLALAGLIGLRLDTGGLDNHVALREHLHPVPVTLLPPLAKAPGGGDVSEAAIAEWLTTAAPQFDGLLSHLVGP